MFAAWIASVMKARKEVLTIMIVMRCRKKWKINVKEVVNESEKIDESKR
jgi:hypothetical protein